MTEIFPQRKLMIPYRKILVLNKRNAQQFAHETPWACISIYCPQDTPAKINKCQLVDIIQLGFDDIDEPEEEFIMFKEEHAQQILDFVEKNWEKVDLLMIHCYAGLCRSPAIAAIISKIYYGEDNYFFNNYCPNKHVYRVLYEVARQRKLF